MNQTVLETWREALAELVAAEDFLDYFGIVYDRAVVDVNRLQILKRWHDTLEAHRVQYGEPEHADYQRLLARAYEDFVRSDAYTEKVMRVHQRAAGIARVPLASLVRRHPEQE